MQRQLPDPETQTEGYQRTRLLKAQADAQEFRNEQLLGQWAPIGPVVDAVSAVLTVLRTRLMLIPRALAPTVAGLPTPRAVESELDRGVRGALASIDPEAVFRAAGVDLEVAAAGTPDNPKMG